MSIVCIWDGMLVERVSKDKWISKVWAMKGPRGNMMNKEIPSPYLEAIEEDYGKALSGEKDSLCKILGERSGDGIKPVSQESKAVQVKTKKNKRLKKSSNSFNPFEKKNEV